MIFLGFLHIVLLLVSGMGLLGLKEKAFPSSKILQFVVFLFAILGRYLDFYPDSVLANVYLLSAFMIPHYKMNFKHSDGFYLYLVLTFILIASGLNISIYSVLFSISALFLTLSLIKKDLLSMLLGVLSIGVVFINQFDMSSLNELVSNAFLIGLLFGYYFHNKNMGNLRFLLLPLFFICCAIVPIPFQTVWILLFTGLYLIALFINYSDQKEEALSFSFLYVLTFKALAPVDFIAVYFLFYGSIEIFKMVYKEFLKINFKEGNVEISYQNVIFLVIATYLFSGTIYTPMSIIFGKLSINESLLFFGIWIIVIIKNMLSIEVDQEVQLIKAFNALIFLSPFLLVLTHESLFSVFNPFSLVGFLVTVSLALMSKKQNNLYKSLKNQVSRLRYYPSQPDFNISRKALPRFSSNNLSLKGPLVEVKLSFPITVGLLFLLWFFISLSFIEV